MMPSDTLIRITVLAGLPAIAVIGLCFVDPVPQDAAYHRFAHSGTVFGMAHAGNVLSNLGFTLVGLLGLVTISGTSGKAIFRQPLDRLPYLVFFTGAVLVSLGSAYYHAAPDNERLVWDRLPMSVAFMALFAAFFADRVNRHVGIVWLLPGLAAAGIASVVYWIWTEHQGAGDLRFYGLVQFYPVIGLSVLCWLFPRNRYTDGRYLFGVFALYALSKGLEHFDESVLSLTGGLVTGHSLKHLAAAGAIYMIVRMLEAVRQQQSV